MDLFERLHDPEFCVDAIDDAIAEIKRLRALTAWRDIASAPKDGTYVLLFFPGPLMDMESPGLAVGRYYTDSGWWVTAIWASGHPVKQPTHWQPLPEPPVAQE